ncbi:Rho guanine nucleotide exchange factor 17 [Smittium mucronatum]|uniref:Rho guanine nucleotide exchange factor 17 n=1 Tax=Smittium mucronatum TaxID=133383 RepID=A0A1R0H826_9FUNG|nr:Rho guanine nucleotide exchange factor 17 [Smittium mucronatum]
MLSRRKSFTQPDEPIDSKPVLSPATPLPIEPDTQILERNLFQKISHYSFFNRSNFKKKSKFPQPSKSSFPIPQKSILSKPPLNNSTLNKSALNKALIEDLTLNSRNHSPDIISVDSFSAPLDLVSSKRPSSLEQPPSPSYQASEDILPSDPDLLLSNNTPSLFDDTPPLLDAIPTSSENDLNPPIPSSPKMFDFDSISFDNVNFSGSFPSNPPFNPETSKNKTSSPKASPVSTSKSSTSTPISSPILKPSTIKRRYSMNRFYSVSNGADPPALTQLPESSVDASISSPMPNPSSSHPDLPVSLNRASTTRLPPTLNRPIQTYNKSKSAEGLAPSRALNRTYTIQQLSRKESFPVQSSFLFKSIDGSKKTISSSENFTFTAPLELEMSKLTPENISDTRSSSLINIHIQKSRSPPHKTDSFDETQPDTFSNDLSLNNTFSSDPQLLSSSDFSPSINASDDSTIVNLPAREYSSPSISKNKSALSDSALSESDAISETVAKPRPMSPIPNNSSNNKSPEAMRLHAAKELVSTEKSFADNLFLIKKIWMDPVFSSANSSKPIIPYNAARVIFFGIDELYLHSQQFYKELSNEVENYESDSNSPHHVNELNIGVLFRSSNRVWNFFVSYVENYGKAIELLNQLSDYKPFFKFQNKIISLKESGRQSLKDMLMLPIQRVMRYSLLLKTLVKYTPIDMRDHIELCRAVKVSNHLASVVNETRRIQEENLKTIEVFKSIENCPAIPPNFKRSFVFEHVVLELVSRQKTRIIVFNDYLIVARSNSSKSSGSGIGLSGSNHPLESGTLGNIGNSNGISSGNISSTVASPYNANSSSNNGENKDVWVFYSYAPLNHTEVQNADENAHTLVTVLALNRYRPPTNTRRRSASVTNLVDKLPDSVKQFEPVSRASDSSDAKFSHAEINVNNTVNTKGFKLSDGVNSGMDPSSNCVPGSANSNSFKSKSNESNSLSPGKSGFQGTAPNFSSKNTFGNIKFEHQELAGRTSNSSFLKGDSAPLPNFGLPSGNELASFVLPPPLRTHVIVLQHPNSDSRRSFVKNLRISKENYENAVLETANKPKNFSYDRSLLGVQNQSIRGPFHSNPSSTSGIMELFSSPPNSLLGLGNENFPESQFARVINDNSEFGDENEEYSSSDYSYSSESSDSDSENNDLVNTQS